MEALADVEDYFEIRASEPCGRSVFGQVARTLKFIERAGRVPKELRLSEDDALWERVRDLEAEAAQATGDVKRRPRQPLVALLAALEGAVMNEVLRDYVRMWAFVKLVKLWMALRADDLRGLPGDKLTLSAVRGLTGEFVRTKTTGAGKTVETLWGHVSTSAWVDHPEWQATGMKLWQFHYYPRDYFVPLPAKDLQGSARAKRSTETWRP